VLNCWADMEDMLGIAHQLPAISDAAAARLERLLAVTALGSGDHGRQRELVATRDSLLALNTARA
jgi:beta-N-acetylhexosaminidase